MPKALVCYYTRTGNTEKMALRVAAGLKDQGLDVDLCKADAVSVKDLVSYDCLVFGSPTYYGTMAWPIKKLLDESVAVHRKLKGKIGGAFASSANLGGGNETTITDILHALLIHGLIIQGEPTGDHYGPVALGRPDQRALKNCDQLAKNLAALTLKLFG
jgi:NAD(P)H dehydrogenase (quinone)